VHPRSDEIREDNHMLVSFSVSNFRSFAAEETFSLVASKHLGDSHPAHAVPIPDSDEKVLRVGVFYGANGAGKSNLFKALRFVKSFALEPRAGILRDKFRFNEHGDGPSSFDLQFIVADKLYRFGFKLDDQHVTEEWLVRVVGKEERPLYERTTDSEGKVTVEAAGLKGQQKISTLATIGGPPYQSFLATIRATLVNPADIGNELSVILSWFENGLNLVPPGQGLDRVGLLSRDIEFWRFAENFLRGASTGVGSLKITRQPLSEDDVRGLYPDLASRVKELQHEAEFLLPDRHKLVISIDVYGTRTYFRINVEAGHRMNGKADVTLDFADESDGTQRLLDLTPALYASQKRSQLYFFDEIERSLHPKLVWEFFEFFLKAGIHGQLIVTTHESNLLDLDLLRRDEIWFAEKDLEGATHLYSLADLKARDDVEIRKHYLQGRFGAVPFFGN
jgi:hypothetical protein